MYQERPILYENVTKGHSHQNNRLTAQGEVADVFGTSSTSNPEQRGPSKEYFQIVQY